MERRCSPDILQVVFNSAATRSLSLHEGGTGKRVLRVGGGRRQARGAYHVLLREPHSPDVFSVASPTCTRTRTRAQREKRDSMHRLEMQLAGSYPSCHCDSASEYVVKQTKRLPSRRASLANPSTPALSRTDLKLIVRWPVYQTTLTLAHLWEHGSQEPDQY